MSNARISIIVFVLFCVAAGVLYVQWEERITLRLQLLDTDIATTSEVFNDDTAVGKMDETENGDDDREVIEQGAEEDSVRDTDDAEAEYVPVSAPEPLERIEETRAGTLTAAGIAEYTNNERTQRGLPPLSVDAQLSQAAEAKVRDIFERNYFAHESPDGAGPADLVATTGYEFITVGENLLLGHFEDDADAVTAWMNSPGHRENILRSGYREIGVAVGEGEYNGRRVWVAVQEFGTPKTVCPEVSAASRAQIESNNALLDEMQNELEKQRTDIENTPNDHPSHSEKVEAYNALVEEYNALLEAHKALIEEFNMSVRVYNACVAGFSD